MPIICYIQKFFKKLLNRINIVSNRILSGMLHNQLYINMLLTKTNLFVCCKYFLQKTQGINVTFLIEQSESYLLQVRRLQPHTAYLIKTPVGGLTDSRVSSCQD